MTNAIPEWGYVENGRCDSCSTLSELWVISTYLEDWRFPQEPTCIPCKIGTIKFLMDDYVDTDAYPQFKAMEPLLVTNPADSQKYGVREETCKSCSGLFAEGSDTVMAYDKNGDAFKVHDQRGCRVMCEGECLTYYAKDAGPWRRRTGRQINVHAKATLTTIEGEEMCIDCVLERYSVDNLTALISCESCGNVGLGEGSFYSFCSSDYCEFCYNDNVYTCDSCDEQYWGEDGHDCDNGVIHEFNYKPRPVFFGHHEARYHLGFELEIENVNDDINTHEMAEITQNRMGEHVYLKSDGSLDDGFEIVSHPHTLESHRNDIRWSMLNELREAGFRSWNTNTCGLHVHVSRTAFGNGITTNRRRATLSQQAHELRFMKLIYDNQRQVERLAGRSANRWASFADKGQLHRKIKYGTQDSGRYSAVNTENSETIEVRVFKGSLKKERVLSALEFVTACVEYTRDLKVTSNNKALSWAKFVSYVTTNETTYPFLLEKINASFETDSVAN